MSYAYNSSIHSSTKYSPAELMFGRRYRLPIDILYGSCETSKFQSISDFQKELKSMINHAKMFMEKRQLQVKRNYDKKRRHDPLKATDTVYVYNPINKGLKLEPNWEGPFEILKCNNHMYKVDLKRDTPNGKWLPRDRLRRCHEVVQDSAPKIIDDIVSENDSTSDSSSSSDENTEDVVPYRYNLRTRPIRQTDRLVVAQISLI